MKKQIPLRVEEDVYNMIKIAAENQGDSMNKFIQNKILSNLAGNTYIQINNTTNNITNNYYEGKKDNEDDKYGLVIEVE